MKKLPVPGNDAAIETSHNVLCEEQVSYIPAQLNDNKDHVLTILDLLDYCIKNKEVDLYYYLLNEASIVSLNNNLIEISSKNANKQYDLRIEKIASDIIGNKVKLLQSQFDHNGNLKSQIASDFKNTSLWQNLEEKFPGCEILDIIHKNG